MRDKSHADQIERWAIYVRENPNKWKAKVKPFIDSQFTISKKFYKRLLQLPNGENKLKRIRGL